DRRSVLTGLGAFGVAGCSPQQSPETGSVEQPARPLARIPIKALDLSALEARNGGRLGVCIQGDAGAVQWRPDERFLYCSTFKLFLAAATLQRVMQGEEQFDRQVPVIATDLLPHAPMTESAVGGTLSIRDLCRAAVEFSDNPAANILIRELGGLDALRAWYRSKGDTFTSIDRLEPQLNRLDGDKDTTSPAQTVRNLGAILTGTLSGLEFKSLMGWLQASPTGPNRIKAGVPAGWTVWHKTGTGAAGPTNDIGYLIDPDVGQFMIAVYYDAPVGVPIPEQETIIAEATRIALKALGHD
ncbi:MAG: class A beta-lactamase, partial [Brevundimonas sp.]